MKMCALTLSASQCLIGLSPRTLFKDRYTFLTMSFSKQGLTIFSIGRSFVENNIEYPSSFWVASMACSFYFAIRELFPHAFRYGLTGLKPFFSFKNKINSFFPVNSGLFFIVIEYNITSDIAITIPSLSTVKDIVFKPNPALQICLNIIPECIDLFHY